METNQFLTDLQEIKNVRAKKNQNIIEVETHLSGFTAKINYNEVLFTQFVTSPNDEKCLQIFYSDGGGIIVTPSDFVFDVVQDEFVQVRDCPPMCSIREMALGFDSYRRNPVPTNDFDINLGQFYLHYYIMKSAISKGFKVDLISKLYEIGMENGYILDDNETSALFNELGIDQRKAVNEIQQMWNGYCPESHMYGKQVRMRLNKDDFYESEETGLQIAVLRGVQAIIMKFRGVGDFRSTVSYADEIENGELLSPQNTDRPPFNSPTEVFKNSKEIESYIKSIK